MGLRGDEATVTAPRPDGWHPRVVLRFIKAFPYSTTPVLVDTDCGEGYLKALGNPQGPHALACELVGTSLARKMRLPTLDFAIINVSKLDEIPLGKKRFAQPGPAFITRKETGASWGGKDTELKMLANPEDISRLIVFDTWVLNCDRCHPDGNRRRPNYDNVFLSGEGARAGKFILKAIDHTHCFDTIPDLTPRIAAIDRVKDARVYGRFPAFEPFVNMQGVARAAADLKAITKGEVEEIVQSLPKEWQVNVQVRQSLVDLVFSRAPFVADNILGWLGFLPLNCEDEGGGSP